MVVYTKRVSKTRPSPQVRRLYTFRCIFVMQTQAESGFGDKRKIHFNREHLSNVCAADVQSGVFTLT